MALMDESVWRGKIFSGGWVGGDLGTGLDASVIEPATGQEIGRTGIATPADVARAAQIAAAAQPAWAATPHTERSAILRRAADIWLAHAADIEWWGIRESGKIPPAMQFETHVATQEIYEAATLPSRAYGELLPSEQPRLSFAERVPVGVTGVIAPFNFPQILAIRSVAPALALGNAVVLKPDPRTAVCGGVVLARVFEEAGLPDGLLHVLPGAGRNRRTVTDPAIGTDSPVYRLTAAPSRLPRAAQRSGTPRPCPALRLDGRLAGFARVEERGHRLGEVPQRRLLHRLRALRQPRVLRPGLGELPALLPEARRARPGPDASASAARQRGSRRTGRARSGRAAPLPGRAWEAAGSGTCEHTSDCHRHSVGGGAASSQPRPGSSPRSR